MNGVTGANEFELIYKIGVCGNTITEHKEFMGEEDARQYLQMKSTRIYIIAIKNLDLI
ncbi:hypothetical protein [Clostridium tagluense]|uniref:hypothetical protein n=1 Tax=Clostridium tagluense TaxID=360422 RepID=UPI001C6F5C3C|nr:hypothetical protein [Clostridium tagluense]MBW9154887.1 hypothetical protein [Clostridium tagluense]WLC64342.1 hypothetical protein KTC93_15890 [Clostridium tagluense]